MNITHEVLETLRDLGFEERMHCGSTAERQQSTAEHHDKAPTTFSHTQHVGPLPETQSKAFTSGPSDGGRCVDEMLRDSRGDDAVDEGCRDGGSGLHKGVRFIQGCRCCARDLQWCKHLAEGAECQAVTVIDLEEQEGTAVKGSFETAAEEHAKKDNMKRCVTGLHDKDFLDCVRAKGKTKLHIQISDESKVLGFDSPISDICRGVQGCSYSGASVAEWKTLAVCQGPLD